ncbi:lipopolysaccharide biosynthesis protein [Chitinophaga alhagiae]|uniref:Lipopolysaccharide biosynthesis protein n=1 Tax=Chitinophaga alhagiae TaxID=2203219 RepID=A0ABM6WB32_9BACT|nr:lipopolysaccharide biosynthesis protein [Chitinophaga alhagiae]AWO01168.1 lipopolysaccharide biosynthesis protein [Chitinophaga alhagiae]
MERSLENLQNHPDKEITLKDIIIQINTSIRYLLARWKIIVLFGILGGGIGLAVSFLEKTKYVAELSFVLEDAKTSQLGAYAGLASQFGIDLGGSTGSGLFSGDNVMEFLKSRLMVEKSLLSTINLNGKNTTLADYYISFMPDLREKIHHSEKLKHISYPKGQAREKFSRLQDSILFLIYKRVTEEDLTVSKPDKKLAFIHVNCVSRNEMFAKMFTERLVKEATQFYVATKTQRSQSNITKLQAKADSLETLLNRKTYSAAASQDLNLNPARKVSTVGTELALRDKTVLLTMYSEVIKNLEINRAAYSQETPIIQIVDTPILPLKKQKLGKLKSLVTGGILGGILICFFLLFRRLLKSIMTN